MISIIIPVRDLPSLTNACLNLIERNTITSEYEIIIVDNGSEVPFNVRTRQEQVSVIRNETNLGFPAAVNQGIKAATGDIICLLNNDVVVTDPWLERLCYHLDHADIVGPLTNFSCGLQARSIPYVYNNYEELVQVANKIYNTQGWNNTKVNWLSGFCLLIKREVIDEIGMLDEVFYPGNYENLDFCMRAKEAGFSIVIADDVFVHHYGSLTHINMEIDYSNLLDINLKLFVSKWGESTLYNQKGE